MGTYVIYEGAGGGHGMMEQGQYQRMQRQTARVVEERRKRDAEEGRKPQAPYVSVDPIGTFEADDWDDAVKKFRARPG